MAPQGWPQRRIGAMHGAAPMQGAMAATDSARHHLLCYSPPAAHAACTPSPSFPKPQLSAPTGLHFGSAALQPAQTTAQEKDRARRRTAPHARPRVSWQPV